MTSTPRPWIRVPYPRWHDGDERFYQVIPSTLWSDIARGENYLRQYPSRPDPPQVYLVKEYQSPLGEWSSGIDDNGDYLDDLSPHGARCFCTACVDAWERPL